MGTTDYEAVDDVAQMMLFLDGLPLQLPLSISYDLHAPLYILYAEVMSNIDHTSVSLGG